MKGLLRLILVILLLDSTSVFSQKGKPLIIRSDSTTQVKNPAFTKDTALVVRNHDTIKIAFKHNPATATLRSLILPGWGQAYNREYWKIPIVYGVIGTMAGIYLYNNMWYKRTRDAYDIMVNRPNSPDTGTINPRLKIFTNPADLAVLRNSFRQDRDYSMLYFFLAWGLNVADATVFGHLKQFDVSNDLSLNINPVIRQNGNAGLSLVLAFKSPVHKHYSTP